MPADYGGSGAIAAAAAAAAVHLDAVEEVPVSWPMLSSPMLSSPLLPPQPQAMSHLTLSPLQVRAATPQVHLFHVYIHMYIDRHIHIHIHIHILSVYINIAYMSFRRR
jgi:hypothetical protein